MTVKRLIARCLLPLLLLRLLVASELRQALKFVATPYDDLCGARTAKIIPLQSVPRYQAVQFLVLHDMRSRAEVRVFNLTYQDFYAHVFEAFSMVGNNGLSLAAVDLKTGEIVGVNLVLRYPQLQNMYAPNAIYEVLNFVRRCYRQKMGPKVNKTWIRILEGSETANVHCHLLREAYVRFHHLGPEDKGGYLLWSSKKYQYDDGVLGTSARTEFKAEGNKKQLSSKSQRALCCGNSATNLRRVVARTVHAIGQLLKFPNSWPLTSASTPYKPTSLYGTSK